MLDRTDQLDGGTWKLKSIDPQKQRHTAAESRLAEITANDHVDVEYWLSVGWGPETAVWANLVDRPDKSGAGGSELVRVPHFVVCGDFKTD